MSDIHESIQMLIAAIVIIAGFVFIYMITGSLPNNTSQSKIQNIETPTATVTTTQAALSQVENKGLLSQNN
ncbi:MAG: hypothetical protein V3U84_05785 [Thiotrichaceae bacterium]